MYLDYQLQEPDRIDIQALEPGEHVCCIYRNDRENALLLASFVEEGFRRGEKVQCTVQEGIRDRFFDALRSLGVDPEPKLSGGQLEILEPEGFYLENGRFRAGDLLSRLRDDIRRAKEQGYPRMRGAGGLPPELARRIDTDELLEYEVKVDELMGKTGSIGMCRYDRYRMPPMLVRRVLPVHPVVAIGRRVFRNFYYTRPGRRKKDDHAEAELQQWIDNLVQYHELERQLRRTGNRYRAIFENTGTAIAIIEDDRTISLVNREFERLTGYSKVELEGRKSWPDLVVPEDREWMRKYHRERREKPGEAPTAYEFRLLSRDGEVKNVYLRVEMIPGTDQSMASVLDITKRKRMQEKLRESEREKALILEAAPAHVVFQDLDHTIKWANRGAAESVGETPEALRGRKCYEVWHDRQEICPDCPVHRAMQTGEECEGEITGKFGNEYLINGRPARNDEGEIIGAVETTIEINEQKKMEKDLKKSRRKLRALTERLQRLREDERRRLSRQIHDELGHQLTAMKIDLSRLEKKVQGNEDDVDAASLTQRLDDMSEMVDEAIDSVHHVASQLRPDALDDLGLEAAIESELERFEERTGIFTVLDCSAETGTLGEARSTALFRICQELLSNVAKHADADRVAVELDEPDESIRLRVTDDGRGIAEEEIGGAGSLGILGIRERARALGGRVALSGEPGEKTVASVRLPYPENADHEDAETRDSDD